MVAIVVSRSVGAAAVVRPHSPQLREDTIAELVPAARERVGGVRVEALQAAAARGAADADVELGPETALVGIRRLEALAELRILTRERRPPFDPARGLEPRERGHELRTGQPERG